MVSILSELNKINFISPIVHTEPVAQFSRCFAGDFRKLLLKGCSGTEFIR